MIFYTYLDPRSEEFEAEKVLFQLIHTLNQVKEKYIETDDLISQLEGQIKQHMRLNPKFDKDISKFYIVKIWPNKCIEVKTILRRIKMKKILLKKLGDQEVMLEK